MSDTMYKIVNVAKDKASDYFLKTKDRNGKTCYIVLVDLWYWSVRYKKWIVCNTGDVSDGATGAYDINSFGWLFHDDIKKYKRFEDRSKCSNWQASMVLHDILKEEDRWFRANSWFLSTLIWGTFF